MRALVFALALLPLGGAAVSAAPVVPHFGILPSGPLDGITDVAGVRVAHLTKIEGASVRTGATAVAANNDPWNHMVSAAAETLNGNGAMTNTQWVNESGHLEAPVVLTDTLDIGRAYDGVVGWMLRRYPRIGITDDVPLPVVAECDDQGLTDERLRSVTPNDVMGLLDRTQTGQFARGSVGAGTGMRAFGFKAGIGSASRVLPASMHGYTVGVLVNDNTDGSHRLLNVYGVPVGERLKNEYQPVYPKRTAGIRLGGRAADGSIIVLVATDAPLSSLQLHALAKRAELGMARTGLISHSGSGDLFLAFSTTYVYTRVADFDVRAPKVAFVDDEDTINTLYLAAVEATQAAIYDALFSAKTMSGNGLTVYGLPVDRVRAWLDAAKQ